MVSKAIRANLIDHEDVKRDRKALRSAGQNCLFKRMDKALKLTQ